MSIIHQALYVYLACCVLGSPHKRMLRCCTVASRAIAPLHYCRLFEEDDEEDDDEQEEDDEEDDDEQL